jgi:hypothetical protein
MYLPFTHALIVAVFSMLVLGPARAATPDDLQIQVEAARIVSQYQLEAALIEPGAAPVRSLRDFQLK